MIRARLLVKLKEEIRDAAGETVADRLRESGFNEVVGVRIGKLIDVDLNTSDSATANEKLEEIARKVLVNDSTEEVEVVGINSIS